MPETLAAAAAIVTAAFTAIITIVRYFLRYLKERNAQVEAALSKLGGHMERSTEQQGRTATVLERASIIVERVERRQREGP